MKLQQEDTRVALLRALCRERGARAIVLSLARNTSWLLGGRVQIGISTDGGICDVVVTAHEVCLLTNNIEAERLRQEEVCSDAVRIISYPWYKDGARAQLLSELCPDGYLTDGACENELYPLRTVLLPEQERELRQNCAVVSDIIEQCCFAVKPGMSEFEIAGFTAQRVYAAGMEPIVLIAACDQRIRRYRHPICTENTLQKYLMLSLGARKNGHYVSITRFVSFGEPGTDMLHAQERSNKVAAMLYAETRPGVAYASLFSKIAAEYAALGCPEQLELHHQGGTGGFQARECRVTPDSPQRVLAGQVFAWNPSVTGFKSEDMLLVGAAENTVLTVTPKLPYEKVSYGGCDFRLPTIVVR